MNMLVRATGTRWLTAVYVRIGYGIPEAIRGPRDALNFLHFRWPPIRDDAYRQALELCTLAIHDRTKLDASREAFIMACIEAKVLD